MRYAERFVGIDTAREIRKLESAYPGRQIKESDVMKHLCMQGVIDKEAIITALTPPAVQTAAALGCCNVITSEGVIVVNNYAVVSFLSHEMRRHNRKLKEKEGLFYKGGRRLRHKKAA
jgi:hypothetical protein